MWRLSHREHGLESPNIRVYYDEELELLILKVMLGVHHESAGGLLVQMIVTLTITGIDILTVRILGASRFGSPRGKHKEPDQALRPETRTVACDWPSLVIEVGVFESLNALHLDACFWLTESVGIHWD